MELLAQLKELPEELLYLITRFLDFDPGNHGSVSLFRILNKQNFLKHIIAREVSVWVVFYPFVEYDYSNCQEIEELRECTDSFFIMIPDYDYYELNRADILGEQWKYSDESGYYNFLLTIDYNNYLRKKYNRIGLRAAMPIEEFMEEYLDNPRAPNHIFMLKVSSVNSVCNSADILLFYEYVRERICGFFLEGHNGATVTEIDYDPVPRDLDIQSRRNKIMYIINQMCQAFIFLMHWIFVTTGLGLVTESETLFSPYGFTVVCLVDLLALSWPRYWVRREPIVLTLLYGRFGKIVYSKGRFVTDLDLPIIKTLNWLLEDTESRELPS